MKRITFLLVTLGLFVGCDIRQSKASKEMEDGAFYDAMKNFRISRICSEGDEENCVEFSSIVKAVQAYSKHARWESRYTFKVIWGEPNTVDETCHNWGCTWKNKIFENEADVKPFICSLSTSAKRVEIKEMKQTRIVLDWVNVK